MFFRKLSKAGLWSSLACKRKQRLKLIISNSVLFFVRSQQKGPIQTSCVPIWKLPQTILVLSIHKENGKKSLNNLEQIHFRDLHMSFQSLSVIDPGEKASSAPQMFLSFQPPRNSISAERRVYVKEFNIPNDKTENYKKFAMRLTTNFKYKQPCICELTYVFSG